MEVMDARLRREDPQSRRSSIKRPWEDVAAPYEHHSPVPGSPRNGGVGTSGYVGNTTRPPPDLDPYRSLSISRGLIDSESPERTDSMPKRSKLEGLEHNTNPRQNLEHGSRFTSAPQPIKGKWKSTWSADL